MAHQFDESLYYDFGPLLSRNGMWNFVVGGRGIGKSYGAKMFAVKRAVKHGELFIYLRRHKEELSSAANAFFADIEERFPDHVFRRSGKHAQVALASQPEDERKWRTIGFFLALSVSSTYKSISYAKVKRIIYDEFIPEAGRRELPDEFKAFTSFYETVDRRQDRCIVLFLANAVSIMNCYFLELEIRPDLLGEWARLHDGYVVAHFPDDQAFKRETMKARFGRFIEGSEYAAYSVDNQFSDNNPHLIATKSSNARYMYSIDTKHGCFSVWMDMVTGEYIALKRRPKQEFTYVLEAARMREGVMLISRTDPRIKVLQQSFRFGRMKFDQPTTRNAFLEVFK